MRPSISEELAGSADLLRRHVLPQVGEALAASQLQAIADSLDRLASAWGSAVADLVAETDATRRCCAALAPLLAEDPDPSLSGLTDRLRAAGTPPMTTDLRAGVLAADLEDLRALLADVVVALGRAGPGSSSRQQARVTLRERLRAGVGTRLGEAPTS